MCEQFYGNERKEGIVMNKKKFKIFITIWPFAMLLLSGLLFHTISVLTGFIAVLPIWIYACLLKD